MKSLDIWPTWRRGNLRMRRGLSFIVVHGHGCVFWGMDIFVFIYLIKCIRGFVSGGLIILVGVMVIYVSHHWPVMMSWCHLIGSPWCHHIPRMIGHKYSLSLGDGSVDPWPTLWKELCHCLVIKMSTQLHSGIIAVWWSEPSLSLSGPWGVFAISHFGGSTGIEL